MTRPQISLDRSSAEMEAAFARAATRLADVRGAMQSMTARLADLASVLAHQRENALVLDEVRDAIMPLEGALAGARSVAVPERFTKAVLAARSAVGEIGARTRELDSVAGLTLVTARSLDLSGFEDYVSNLRDLGARMREDVGRLDDAVCALRERRTKAALLLDEAGEVLSSVAVRIAALTQSRGQNERLMTATLADIAARADRLPAIAAAETDSLVRAMQFADTVAQRLAHVGAILAASDPAAQTLAGAQIRALVTETRQTMQDVIAALERVDAAARGASQVLGASGEGKATAAAEAVELGRGILSNLAEGAGRALDAIGQAAEESDRLRHLATEANERFASLVRTTESVHLAAINASLLARTDDGREKAIKVLSVEVQQQASACGRASVACRQAVSALSLPHDMEAFVAVSRAAEDFAASVGRTTGSVETSSRALGDLDGLRRIARDSLERLSDGIMVAREAVQRILAEADTLAEGAAALPVGVMPGTRALDSFQALYTMEAERRVHRQLLGLPEPDARPAAVTGGDPLESILF